MTYDILSALEVAPSRGRWLTAASLVFFIGSGDFRRESGDRYETNGSYSLATASRGG